MFVVSFVNFKSRAICRDPSSDSAMPRAEVRVRALALAVQRLDNAIHRINRYPKDKCRQNKPRYPLDSDLSGG